MISSHNIPTSHLARCRFALRQTMLALTSPWLPPHPHLLVRFLAGRILHILDVPKLNFPHPKFVLRAVGHARMYVERPPMLRTRYSGAKNHTKVFNVKRGALREWVGRVGTSLQSHIRNGDGCLRALYTDTAHSHGQLRRICPCTGTLGLGPSAHSLPPRPP